MTVAPLTRPPGACYCGSGLPRCWHLLGAHAFVCARCVRNWWRYAHNPACAYLPRRGGRA